MTQEPKTSRKMPEHPYDRSIAQGINAAHTTDNGPAYRAKSLTEAIALLEERIEGGKIPEGFRDAALAGAFEVAEDVNTALTKEINKASDKIAEYLENNQKDTYAMLEGFKEGKYPFRVEYFVGGEPLVIGGEPHGRPVFHSEKVFDASLQIEDNEATRAMSLNPFSIAQNVTGYEESVEGHLIFSVQLPDNNIAYYMPGAMAGYSNEMEKMLKLVVDTRDATTKITKIQNELANTETPASDMGTLNQTATSEDRGDGHNAYTITPLDQQRAVDFAQILDDPGNGNIPDPVQFLILHNPENPNRAYVYTEDPNAPEAERFSGPKGWVTVNDLENNFPESDFTALNAPEPQISEGPDIPLENQWAGP